jgi:hypothetical protein
MLVDGSRERVISNGDGAHLVRSREQLLEVNHSQQGVRRRLEINDITPFSDRRQNSFLIFSLK